MRRARRVHPEEFKRQAVAEVQKYTGQGSAWNAVARKYDIGDTLLRTWAAKYGEEKPTSGPGSKTKSWEEVMRVNDRAAQEPEEDDEEEEEEPSESQEWAAAGWIGPDVYTVTLRIPEMLFPLSHAQVTRAAEWVMNQLNARNSLEPDE